MSRQNVVHTIESMEGLLAIVEEQAQSIRDVMERWKKDAPKARISLAHRASVDNGLLAIMKFVRETQAKLDDLADQKRIEELGRSAHAR